MLATPSSTGDEWRCPRSAACTCEGPRDPSPGRGWPPPRSLEPDAQVGPGRGVDDRREGERSELARITKLTVNCGMPLVAKSNEIFARDPEVLAGSKEAYLTSEIQWILGGSKNRSKYNGLGLHRLGPHVTVRPSR